MHASIRQYRLAPGTTTEFNRKVNEGFLPLVRQSDGFISYHAVDGGNGAWLSISVFETKEGADASANLAREFVAEHLQPMVESGPSVVAGDLVASAR